MNQNSNLFYEILQKYGIECSIYNAQRHCRMWLKSTYGAYKLMSYEELYASIEAYIKNALPDENSIRLDGETLNHFGIDYSLTLHKQFDVLGIDITDTLQGYYISSETLSLVETYIKEYTSLLEVFNTKTELFDCKNEYHDFVKLCRAKKIDLILIPFHPGEGKLFFHESSSESVNDALFEWITCSQTYFENGPDECMSLEKAADLLGINIFGVYEFASNHRKDIVQIDSFIYPLIESVKRWQSDLYESKQLSKLIESVRKEFKYISRERALNAIQKLIAEEGFAGIYTGQELIGKDKNEWFYNLRDENEVRDAVRRCLGNLQVSPIDVLRLKTGLSADELENAVANGLIKAAKTLNGYTVSRSEIARIENLCDNIISLENVLIQITKEKDSLFDFNKAKCREDIYAFIELNDFWGIEYFLTDEIPIKAGKNKYFIKRSDEMNLRHRLNLWIESYGMANDYKFEILLGHYWGYYTKTCQALLSYFTRSNNSGYTAFDKAVIDMADALLPMLDSDLSEMSEDEIQDIIEHFKESSQISCNCLVNFLFDCGYTNKRYVFDGTGVSPNTSAYSLQAFAVMAYSAINEESWADNELISKAVANKRYANLWLFVALHLFAAWRSTDFERLQAPALQYSAENTLKQIKEGTYKKEDAKIITLRFLSQIQLSSLKPNKNSRYENVPELHIFCPQSCEYPFGIILSIAAAHFALNPMEPQFVCCINDIRTIRNFFGNAFLDASDKRQFSTRRANKSLMQSVETVADGGEKNGMPRPYILASIMRSHKGGYGSLAESTAIYLRDANFTGYTPTFIAEQMFERGVCSFVANELLKISLGNDYTKLTVPAQTQMIKTLGLTAGEIDKIVRVSQKAEDESISLVRDLLGNEDNKEKAGSILKSMLMGCAAGKDFNSLCVLRASGHNCAEPSRLSCVGCKYEIKTKALLLHYTHEYSRISEELKNKNIKSNSFELKRRRYIINNVIYPAIEEILITLEGNITVDELIEYKNLTEEALRFGD